MTLILNRLQALCGDFAIDKNIYVRLEHKVYFLFLFSFSWLLDCLIPFRFMGRVMESVPAEYGWRQGSALDESPVICRALCEHLGVRYLGSALKVSWHPPLVQQHLLCFFSFQMPQLLHAWLSPKHKSNMSRSHLKMQQSSTSVVIYIGSNSLHRRRDCMI